MRGSKAKGVLLVNIKFMLEKTGMHKDDVCRKANVSRRYIDMLLHGDRAPSIDIVEGFAKAFGLPTWVLLLPHLPELSGHRVDQLVDDFATANDDGKKYILHAAKREAAPRP